MCYENTQITKVYNKWKIKWNKKNNQSSHGIIANLILDRGLTQRNAEHI